MANKHRKRGFATNANQNDPRYRFTAIRTAIIKTAEGRLASSVGRARESRS